MNTLLVSLVRCSGQFLKWTKEELQQIDQRIRKLVSIQKALHPNDDMTIYIEKKRALKIVLKYQNDDEYFVKRAKKD